MAHIVVSMVLSCVDVRVGPEKDWELKNWCFQLVVLEKTLESPLNFKEIKIVNPKGNQPWIFIGMTDVEASILWPPDTKSWLVGKDPDAGKMGTKRRGQHREETVRWHSLLRGYEYHVQRCWRTEEPGVLQSIGSRGAELELASDHTPAHPHTPTHSPAPPYPIGLL